MCAENATLFTEVRTDNSQGLYRQADVSSILKMDPGNSRSTWCGPIFSKTIAAQTQQEYDNLPASAPKHPQVVW